MRVECCSGAISGTPSRNTIVIVVESLESIKQHKVVPFVQESIERYHQFEATMPLKKITDTDFSDQWMKEFLFKSKTNRLKIAKDV